jgi:hypothetical protein
MTTPSPVEKLLRAALIASTERMANECSVNQELWNEHSNLCLQAAAALEAQPAMADGWKMVPGERWLELNSDEVWSAYSAGIRKDGKWWSAGLSDAEWLERQGDFKGWIDDELLRTKIIPEIIERLAAAPASPAMAVDRNRVLEEVVRAIKAKFPPSVENGVDGGLYDPQMYYSADIIAVVQNLAALSQTEPKQ